MRKVSIFFGVLLFVMMAVGCGGGGGEKNANNPPANSAALSWKPPSTRVNGSPLTDLAGFRIYYGKSPDDFNSPEKLVSFQVTKEEACKPACRYTVKDLAAGRYYFAVTAYDKDGNESPFSNIQDKEIK